MSSSSSTPSTPQRNEISVLRRLHRSRKSAVHTMMRMHEAGRRGLSGEPVLHWSAKRNNPATVGNMRALPRTLFQTGTIIGTRSSGQEKEYDKVSRVFETAHLLDTYQRAPHKQKACDAVNHTVRTPLLMEPVNSFFTPFNRRLIFYRGKKSFRLL